ncbi:hypothetical protein CRE_02649 [Caenorhabditis remanei]|uniref:ATP-dependent DNA helicase n=1 Tax=Caenorhabditis remanei TaxID=31234 RepID=E3NG34_CAERE|nr:hypothetical protein CRE_02649 [Caenorhabditis remanei]
MDVRQEQDVEYELDWDEEEYNPENLNDQQILDQGLLEDEQEFPVDDEIGQQNNITMKQRKGEMYPVIDRNQRTIDIPLVSGNPFGPDSDSEEEPPIDRYRDGTDNYDDYVFQEMDNVDMDREKEVELEEDRLKEREESVRGSREEEDEAEEDEHDVLENDAVCYGDEHDAEPLALARKNDGVLVKNIGQRQNVSRAEHANFLFQDREEIPNRYQGESRTLGQLVVIDYGARMIEGRMNALLVHRSEFHRFAGRSQIFKFQERMVNEKFDGVRKLGQLATLPSSVPGTVKYQRELVMTGVTLANMLGKPHLFITYTGNPRWPEIQRETKLRGVNWTDLPTFVNTVFWTRFEIFIEEDLLGPKKKISSQGGKVVREGGNYGVVRWFIYSVEFQQRGMPHVHLIVCLEKPITTAAEVDDIITAEVPEMPKRNDPEYEDKLRYFNLVKDMMIHFPCENDPTAYCREGAKLHWKQCVKSFPKKMSDFTVLTDNQYPDYKRTNTNKFVLYRKGKAHVAGSEYVVSHNKPSLMKHECHINVEVITTLSTLKYIFKYLFKGPDRMLLEVCENIEKGNPDKTAMTLRGNVFAPANLPEGKLRARQRQADKMMDAAGVTISKDKRLSINECTAVLDMAAMTANEAAWKLASRPMHGCSHTVFKGYVHEENNELMYFKRGLSAASAKKLLEEKSGGQMSAWFNENKHPKLLKNGKMTSDLTFPEMFRFYMFNMKTQKFILRKRDLSGKIFGRVQAPQPRNLELTAVRLLAHNVCGPTSWQDLRTYKNVVYPTCLQAARARRLMNGEQEWNDLLTEIAEYESPIESRRMFASVLLNCAPANPKVLWENHWETLVSNKTSWSESQKKAHALRHINFLLERSGMHLGQFELGGDYKESELPPIDPAEDIDNPNFVNLSRNEHEDKGRALYRDLNTEQKNFVDRVLVMDGETEVPRMVFVGGAGGTGKTYCYNTIYHLLMSQDKKVGTVSHAGIAASLLPNGCTAHRKFSIPLEVSDGMNCGIVLGSEEASALRALSAVIWDEVCMSDRRIVSAVDNLFRDLHDSLLPFGGILIIMGGDWRQILPIVQGVRDQGVIPYILKNCEDIWNRVETFHLTINQRAIDDPDYSRLILEIGDGSNYVHEKRQMVSIPDKLILTGTDTNLVDWVFPDVNTYKLVESSAVLTVDNRTALRINEYILDKLNGELREFASIDTADKDNALNVDPAIFATETPAGMPPHRLRLKVGAQIVLLRNLSVEAGLCNGTRLTIVSFGEDVRFFIIYCHRNTDPKKQMVFLHRILMSPSGKGGKSCGFRRRQFPIRLSYASTINKAQGQTLSRCGLLLHSPVFSHGQLYVAMSRVRRSQDFRIWHYKRGTSDDNYIHGGILVRNVVYREVFQLGN